MTTQDIFKNFGPNWKWASVSHAGAAAVHTGRPKIQGDSIFYATASWDARSNAFDQPVPPEGIEPVVWERTDYDNGPAYDTDAFGIPLCPPNVPELPPFAPKMDTAPSTDPYCASFGCISAAKAPSSYCAVHQIGLVRVLTTDEAENGALWQFAKDGETFSRVDKDGAVYFFADEAANLGRLATDVKVADVQVAIQRSRGESTPAVTFPVFHPNHIIQYADEVFVWHDEAGLMGGVEYSLEMANLTLERYATALNTLNRTVGIEKAKSHAQRLLSTYVAEGGGTRPALNELQYLAIFGELPQ